MRMESIEAYRVDDRYTLELPEGAAALSVRVELRDGVRLARSGKGQLLLYREYDSYGQTLTGALAMGWARLAEEPSVLTSVPHR